MRGPSLTGFGLDMSEAGAGRRIGDADQMLASGTLNLPPGVARVALQRLIAMGTIEFKFIRAHRFIMRKPVAKIHKDLFMLLVGRLCL